MGDITLQQGAIGAPSHRRSRAPVLSYRGGVLIAAVLFCAVFWAIVGHLIAG